ncbi:MAG TPA: hypothetical protein PLY73_00090 [Candidatus Ozemobacteraceae bacterium]|nr:hypothetical protein [Candidatus Ozemobacteraceae bacterium]
MKTLSREQFLRTFSRHAQVWLLGILLFACSSAASALIPEAISRAVVSVPTRTVNGVASPRNISQLLLGVCKAGGTSSFAEQMRMAGGEWRLIETPTAAHLVMLLPQAAQEAEALLGSLFDQITAGLRQPLTPPAHPQLNELLLATAIGEYHDNEAKASLWIDGPLAEAQFRLESRLSTILPGDASPLAPPRDFLRYSGASAAVARVLTWEPSTPDAHFTARYIGESFVALPNFPQGTTAFDVWDLPTRTVLVLVASAAIHEIDQRERIIDSFLRDRTSPRANDPRWTGFASASVELISFDRRDLAKSALIAAQAKRNAWNLPERPTIRFVPPTSSRLILIFPDETLNQFMIERTTRPEIVIANITGTAVENREFVDAALLIKAQLASMPEQLSSLNKLLEDDSIPSLQLIEQTGSETLIAWSMPFSEMSSTLTAIRSDLSACFQPEYPGASDSSSASMTIHLAVVGAYPPYRLLNRVHEAWPIVEATESASLPLTPESLKQLVKAKSSDVNQLRGRWKLCTASQSGLARFLAKLGGAGISIRNLSEVEKLLQIR